MKYLALGLLIANCEALKQKVIDPLNSESNVGIKQELGSSDDFLDLQVQLKEAEHQAKEEALAQKEAKIHPAKVVLTEKERKLEDKF